MTSSRFPEELDSIPLISAGRTPVTGTLVNYLLSASKSMEDAIGEAPLTSSTYTLQSTLADQFKEFFRIECGEVEREFMEAPKTTTTNNAKNYGQNAVMIGGVYPISDAISGSEGWELGQPAIYLKDPELFETTLTEWTSGTYKLFYHASVVAVMSEQGEWEEVTGIGNRMPTPSDWPDTYTISLIPYFVSTRLKGLIAWVEMGGMSSLTADSDGNFPRTFPKGTKVKVRYMVMEVRWL